MRDTMVSSIIMPTQKKSQPSRTVAITSLKLTLWNSQMMRPAETASGTA